MKTLFIIYTKEEEAIGWARNAIDVIGIKEHIARTRYNNNDSPLYTKRYNDDNEEYEMIKKKLFN